MVSPWTASKGDYRQEKEMRKWSEWAGKERCSEKKGTGVNNGKITKVNRLPLIFSQFHMLLPCELGCKVLVCGQCQVLIGYCDNVGECYNVTIFCIDVRDILEAH